MSARGRDAAPGRLRHHVGQAIAEHGLWSPGDTVTVAVSGGLDSMVLLDLLLATRDWHRGAIEVATVDHGTRPSAREDADFVERTAHRLGLRCRRFALSLGPDASEDELREARYRALESSSAAAIAVAHHEDDQAETVILQLLRGTGVRGLAGMGWRNGRIVRPLLATPREDLVRWAAWRRIAWRDDPTNRDPRFLRNRVRHEVIPLLEAVRPGASRALARSASVSAADAELVERLVAGDPEAAPHGGGWSRRWVARSPEALVHRALAAVAPEVLSSHAAAVVAAARRGHGAVELPDGTRIVVDEERVRIERIANVAPKRP